jgi:hypothetical protein
MREYRENAACRPVWSAAAPENTWCSRLVRKTPRQGLGSASLDGGQGGIRTHDTLLTYTHFPGARLRPLGHLSITRRNRRPVPGGRRTLVASLVRSNPPLRHDGRFSAAWFRAARRPRNDLRAGMVIGTADRSGAGSAEAWAQKRMPVLAAVKCASTKRPSGPCPTWPAAAPARAGRCAGRIGGSSGRRLTVRRRRRAAP